MSKTLAQIFAINPTTVINNTDLFYLVQPPYTPGSDAGITGASIKALFLQPANNLSDLFNASTARTNLGLTTVATVVPSASAVMITSAGSVPSFSQTLPSIVQGNITTLGTQSQLINMGGFRITNMADGIAATDAATVGQVTASSSPLTTKGDLYTFTTVNARLPVGTVNGQVLQVNSVTATGLSYSSATYPATATNTARLLRADGTNWVETTSTFADIYAASSILFSNIANNITGLPTANNGLLVTSATGVPSILAGPGATGRILQSNAAAAPSFSTATYPSTGGTSGNILISDGTNYISSTSLWPNTVGTSGKVVISNGTSNVYSTPTFPNASATTGKFIISDGTNWIASTPTLPNSATTTGTLLRADGTNWVATTSTYPNTNAINTLLYASAANVMSALATANSGVLTTDSSGVPSISSTLPAFTTSSITFSPTTGGIVGTTTNDSAAAGKVGEIVTASVTAASATSIATATPVNITSISLTAGQWLVVGNGGITFAGANGQFAGFWISTTSATLPDGSLRTGLSLVTGTMSVASHACGPVVLQLAGTTTVYLSAQCTFATSTAIRYGSITAIRSR